VRLSLGWLREWVDWGEDDRTLLERLPLRGFEVESVAPFAVGFRGIRLARIVRTAPLDGREGSLFELELGGPERPRVVSTDPRPRAGDWVAYAPPGSSIAGGVEVRPRLFGEVVSEGMLASWAELGLGRESDRVLLVPDPAAPPGTDFARLLGVGETLVEIAVTPNRGDAMSVHGLAREISAFLGVPLRRRSPPPFEGPWREDLRIEDPEACTWFGLMPVRDVTTRRLSLRRRLRLEQAGVSSQHPLVDLTNYILLELGQPLHAFDASALGPGVHVRWGRAGESLELLGGERLALGPSHLVVADEGGARSLAGVLGGKTSALGEETKTAWVEAAHFVPCALGRRPERLRIVTDAAQRFERGVDPTLPPVALTRLKELLEEEGVGSVGGPVRRALPPRVAPRRRITLGVGETGRRLGVPEDELDVPGRLRALGLEVTATATAYDVVIPPHRFDLVEDVDLVEEVARLHGFENIAAEAPTGRLVSPARRDLTPQHRVEETIRRFLTARGYDECRHLALVDPEPLRRLEPSFDPILLANPLSRETAALATTLWERLLATASANLRRQQDSVRIFEIGSVFRPPSSRDETTRPPAALERRMLAVLGVGMAYPARWCHEKRAFDFYDLKGDLEDLLRALGYGPHASSSTGFRWAKGAHPALNPYATARLIVRTKDGEASTLRPEDFGEDDPGVLGHLLPQLAEAYGIDRDVYISYIDIKRLYNIPHSFYEDPQRYPMIVRDLAFVFPIDRPAGDLVDVLYEHGGEFLRAVEVFDNYAGPELPAGRRSLAVRLTFGDRHGTLTDAAITEILARLVAVVEGRFGGQVRG